MGAPEPAHTRAHPASPVGLLCQGEGMSRLQSLLSMGTLLLCVAALLLYQPSCGMEHLRAALAAAPAPAAGAPGARGVVLTLATNCRDFGGLQRFLASLRKHTPSAAKVVVITDAWSLANDARLGVLFAMYDATVELFDAARDLPALPTEKQLPSDQYRWLLYSGWLNRAAGAACARGAPPAACPPPPFDFVMFTDSRDVVFQADVFAALQAAQGGGRGFYPILEAGHDTVGGSEYNARWVDGCFGAKGLERVARSIVSCAGTSLGAWEDARAYAQLMVDTILRLATPSCMSSDQGIHNYLLHTGEIGSLVGQRVYPQTHEDGFVVSLGTAQDFQLDHFGRVLNAAGALAAAVHQYDRWPHLKASLETLYPWITDDEVWQSRPKLERKALLGGPPRRYAYIGALLALVVLWVPLWGALPALVCHPALPLAAPAVAASTALRPVWSAGGSAAPSSSRARVEDVMGAHKSRLTREAWQRRSEAAALYMLPPPPPPPIFFLTAARSWGKSSPAVEAVREEQYASNLGGILALGYQVYLAVSPTGGRKWDLVEALAASAAPGQLRVHYCSNATAVARRSGGPDEILCMQEAIEALFEGCLLPWEPFTPLVPPPSCCPAPNTHIIRMSGRYLMAKYHLLHAILERGEGVDAFVKWGTRWTESKDIDYPQAYTFFLSMRFKAFVDCHMNWLTAAGDDGSNGEHPSVWRFSIELLTGRCIMALPKHEAMAELGIVANVGNSATYEYY